MAENTRRMNNEPVFGSLAYDLNTLNWGEFDGNAVRQPQEQPQEPLRRPERRERPRQEPRRRPAARPREHASPVMLAGVAVLLMMVVVLMMGYIRLMQASHDVTVKQAQLQQAQEASGITLRKIPSWPTQRHIRICYLPENPTFPPDTFSIRMPPIVYLLVKP